MRVSTGHIRICAPMLALALFASACGGGSAPPAAPSSNTPGNTPGNSLAPSSGVINVTGTEKIGWNQAADSSSTLAGYQYLGYVDGVSQVLPNAACGTTAASD